MHTHESEKRKQRLIALHKGGKPENKKTKKRRGELDYENRGGAMTLSTSQKPIKEGEGGCTKTVQGKPELWGGRKTRLMGRTPKSREGSKDLSFKDYDEQKAAMKKRVGR